MAWYLDAFIDRRDGGIEIVANHKWIMPCNWKFPAENFGGDAYHVPWSHLSAITTSFSTGVTTKPNATGTMVSPGNGHIAICVGPEMSGEPPGDKLLEDDCATRAPLHARLGPPAPRVT